MLTGRVRPAAAGHDRRPDKRPEPIADQAVFARSGAAARVGPQVADAIRKVPGVVDVLNGIENTISGPAMVVPCGSEVAARSRLHAGGSCRAGRQRASCRGTGADAGNRQRPAPTPFACASPRQTRASVDAMRNTHAHQCHRTYRDAGLAGNDGGTPRTDRNPPREPAARCHGHRAAGRPRPRAAAWPRCRRPLPDLHLPLHIRVEYGGAYPEQQRSFHDLLLVLLLAVVLVFTVLLFEFRSIAAPLAILSSACSRRPVCSLRCWSPARPSIWRRLWD